MSGIKDQKNIDELRKRLYERDLSPEILLAKRHSLTKSKTVDISRGWGSPRLISSIPQIPIDVPVLIKEEIVDPIVHKEVSSELPISKPKSRSYRWWIILSSVAIFVLAIAISSVYLFLGANQISGRNISINTEVPFTVAAGEKMSLQVNIANNNSVPIESATLIINYPTGTKTIDEKDLFESRVPIEVITTGESRNIPISAVMFGEENETKEIKVSIEYRIEGSNTTFFKEATPSKIQISSSPLVLRVSAVEKVSSGQEIEVKLTVQSNASIAQKNILIKANYPNSFYFISSSPEPSYSQNEWVIKELLPGKEETITLRGKVNGVTGELSVLQFEAGTPKSDNQFMMGSVLSKTKTEYFIERAFLKVSVDVNGDTDGNVFVSANDSSQVKVSVTNTLEEPIYDMRVEIEPKGNLIRDALVSVSSGYYDTNNKTIRYEVSGMSELAEIAPGETRNFYFSVSPDKGQPTASFSVSTKVFARRVREVQSIEDLVGTALSEVKYSSVIQNRAEVGHSNANFVDIGSVPPVANKTTTYTLTFEVETGVNDVTDAVLITALPQYVDWQDVYEGEGKIDFNPVSKQIRWTIGNMSAKSKQQLKIQVGLLPSVKQVGTTPTIVGNQEFKAVDRFTGQNLSVINTALNTELSAEAGYAKDNGRVVAE